MKVQINNRSLFFAIENCWAQLSYKLKYQINQLVTLNDEDEFVQEVDVDKDSFVLIMNAVNSQPQGIAKEINPLMYDSLKEQIIQLAGTGDTEAIAIAGEMEKILMLNADMLAKKIINGKTQIIAP